MYCILGIYNIDYKSSTYIINIIQEKIPQKYPTNNRFQMTENTI